MSIYSLFLKLVTLNYVSLHSRYSQPNHVFVLSCISLVNVDDITEVRCGQQTRNFNLFPYVEVDKQSFSLIFQKEKGLPAFIYMTQCQGSIYKLYCLKINFDYRNFNLSMIWELNKWFLIK